MPALGVWTAVMRIDADVHLPTSARAVTLDLEGQTFVGTVRRQAVFAGVLDAMIVAGAGGFRTTALAAKKYQAVPLSIPLRDVLDGAGELLSSTSSSGILQTFLPYWARLSGRAAAAFAELLDVAGATWRVLPDGTVWVGVEETVETALVAGEIILEEHGAMGARPISIDAAHVLPGHTLNGTRVGSIKYHISSGSFRAVAYS